jgi:N-sulfoglucosamine sulfohydrolase
MTTRSINLVSGVILTAAITAFVGPPCAAEEPARPNVLFVIADDWSVHAGAYGTSWINTPGFDRVAREGLLFNNAFTPNAKCAPSRAIVLTGRHSWQLEEAGNHMAYFPLKFKSYPEALAEHGYFVGTTGKGWGPGGAHDADGRPRAICGTPFQQRKARPPASAMSTNDYAANFIDFLDAAPEGRPWCFWFGSSEPHRPYEYGAGVAKGGKQLGDVDRVPDYWPDNETVRNDMLDYAFEVEHVDRHLVRMLEEIERRGRLDNTLVVVTSDHGMPFPRLKGQAYLDSNRVPLAVRWPAGIRHPGRVIDDFVDFTDLAATFLDAAGVEWSESGMAPLTGRSWRPIFESDKSGRVDPSRDHVLIGKERHDVGRPGDVGYPIRGLVRDGFLYLKNYKPDRWPAGNPETGYLNTDGSPTKTVILEARRRDPADRFWALNFGKRPAEELYDLRNDPDCVRNLAGDEAYAERRARMHEQMTAKLKEQGDPRMFGKGDVFDRYPITNVPVRNFHERSMSGERPRAGWVNESDFEEGPLD